MQIQSNGMWYSIILREFAKRAQKTLELLQKVICYPLECMNKSKKITIFNDLEIFPASISSFWTTVPTD